MKAVENILYVIYFIYIIYLGLVLLDLIFFCQIFRHTTNLTLVSNGIDKEYINFKYLAGNICKHVLEAL